jgi:hypothetical protein
MRWLLNAGGLRVDPKVVCYVCRFNVLRHHAVRVNTPVGISNWRHQQRHLCFDLIAQKAVSDKLLGVTDEP